LPIAEAIRRAVFEDQLVDQAAELNLHTARERLEAQVVKPKIVTLYNQIFAQANSSTTSTR